MAGPDWHLSHRERVCLSGFFEIRNPSPAQNVLGLIRSHAFDQNDLRACTHTTLKMRVKGSRKGCAHFWFFNRNQITRKSVPKRQPALIILWIKLN